MMLFVKNNSNAYEFDEILLFSDTAYILHAQLSYYRHIILYAVYKDGLVYIHYISE